MSMKKRPNYLTNKEIRAISKANAKEMNALEKRKRRKCDESEFITKMKDERNILEIEDLHTYFFTDQGVIKAVNGVSFEIPKNSTVGIVGESGCGKSVTSMSVMQLIQGPQGQIYSGSIRFAANENTYDIAKMPSREIYRVRGSQIAMIFQEPMTSLNPVFTIGEQLDEVTLVHRAGATKEQARERSLEMLNLVGISAPERIYRSFPHELSGGMRQRVMIAMALICDPRLIIADEPTTALDVTIQAQILDLLREVKEKISGSIMLITHDLGVIAEMCDYVVVMYAGKVVERGTASEIYHNPLHPYTVGLQRSKPTMTDDSDTLYNIPGNVPNPVNMPSWCFFRDRCEKCTKDCKGAYPDMIKVSDTHYVACHLYGKEEENG